MWFIYVSLLVLFIYLLDQFLLDKRKLELGEKFNGPRRLPIVGNAFAFIGIGPKGERSLHIKTQSKSIMTFTIFGFLSRGIKKLLTVLLTLSYQFFDIINF